jgi:hypothetical protein
MSLHAFWPVLLRLVRVVRKAHSNLGALYIKCDFAHGKYFNYRKFDLNVPSQCKVDEHIAS